MKWIQWAFAVGWVWYIQSTKGEVLAAVYLIGILGYFGYSQIISEIKNTRRDVSSLKDIIQGTSNRNELFDVVQNALATKPSDRPSRSQEE